jgi:hypothetical protein
MIHTLHMKVQNILKLDKFIYLDNKQGGILTNFQLMYKEKFTFLRQSKEVQLIHIKSLISETL